MAVPRLWTLQLGYLVRPYNKTTALHLWVGKVPLRLVRNQAFQSRRPLQSGISMAAIEGPEPPSKVQKVCLENVNGLHNGVSVAAHQALQVKRLSDKAIIPSRGSAKAAGYDLSSAYDAVVPARGKALIKTDLSIAIPEDTYARIAPRSGLAWKHSIDVGAGVVDSDYRGPLSVILFNLSDVDFNINAGDRIAQLILERIITPDVVEVEELSTTVRGEAGFGSTGVVTIAKT